MERAERYVHQARSSLAQGLRPRLMCPLNDDGLCGLYEHRLMICRMHGTANMFTKPDGSEVHFPGCFRFEEAVADLDKREHGLILDRTPLYRRLVELEVAYLGDASGRLPRVDLTLAEMLVAGPPRIR
jgi:hypothetical protein